MVVALSAAVSDGKVRRFLRGRGVRCAQRKKRCTHIALCGPARCVTHAFLGAAVSQMIQRVCGCATCGGGARNIRGRHRQHIGPCRSFGQWHRRRCYVPGRRGAECAECAECAYANMRICVVHAYFTPISRLFERALSTPTQCARRIYNTSRGGVACRRSPSVAAASAVGNGLRTQCR